MTLGLEPSLAEDNAERCISSEEERFFRQQVIDILYAKEDGKAAANIV